MRDIVIGTAGHIDHGKTTLVKFLTGKDTDSLSEEKRRGMTIDIGFAFLTLKSGKTLGIVDVPGHEKFIKNMVAGVTGIDMIILVIACDDGIKPQTIEHTDILQMLGVQRGVIVLTKRDLVDEERVEKLKKEIREFFKGTFLEKTEILEFSIKNPESCERIKDFLEREMENFSIFEERKAPFKMDIDRVFSVKGFGTVITGTSKNAPVKIGDTLMLYPQMKEVKVRNIESNGVRKDKLPQGNRCALNILDVDVKDIKRGDVIAQRDSLILSDRIDCLFTLLKRKGGIKNNHRVRVNIGTAEVIGRIKIFGTDEITSGEKAFIQLEFEKVIPISAGERGIVRNFSPVETIGGIKIINGAGEKIKRKDPVYIEKLKKMASSIKAERVEGAIKINKNIFFQEKDISLLLGEEITSNELKDFSFIEEITEDIFIHKKDFEELQERIGYYLKEYHQNNPLAYGVKVSQLKNRYFEKLPLMVYNKILVKLREKGILKEDTNFVALKEFQVKLTGEQKKIKDRIFKIYKEMKFLTQPSKKIAEEFPNSKIFQEVHQYMVDHLFIINIGEDRYILKGYFTEAEKLIREKITKDKKITLREGAQLLNTNRETALLILEKLDTVGVTKRVDNYRILKDL